MQILGTATASGLEEVAGSLGRVVFDEESFGVFYEKTARPLRGYLLRMTGDLASADDLLQESYLRLLGARLPEDMTEEHRKNYLFRIATNLLRDRRPPRTAPLSEAASAEHMADRFAQREDMRQMLDELKPRERELLWLAYVEQFSHVEIAAIMGTKANSIRPMLARAREKFARVLRRGL